MADRNSELHREAEILMALCDSRLAEVLRVLESQLNTLHTRAQVLLTFCGIIITTTGFSGRLVAGTHLYAQVTIIAGLAMVLASGGFIYYRIGGLRWVTSGVDLENPMNTISAILRRRDEKTRAYQLGGYLLFIGLVFYSVAVAIMLLNPEVLQVPVR